MSQVIYMVNDSLKEYTACGQGWDGFYLWTASDKDDINTTPLNYFANRAFDTKTSVRFIDEYELIDGEDATIRTTYRNMGIEEMKAWLAQRSPRYYKN